MIKTKCKLFSVLLIAALVFSSVAIPQKTYAASKKSKTTYSVSVQNINSNTVLKKGTKIKIAYKATKKKNGVVKGTKVKFKSSNKKVASVSKKGVITAKKKGTAYITVYCKSKPSKKKKIKIRVGTPVSSIKVSGYRYLHKGRSTTFSRSTNSGATNKSVKWWSDNTAVATVNSSGKVTAKGYGTATIYATAKDGSGVSGSRTVTVYRVTKDVNWIAHRGLHTSYKENTADAFRAAGNAGFWGCECDIWETAHTPVKTEALPEEPAPEEDEDIPADPEADVEGDPVTEPVQDTETEQPDDTDTPDVDPAVTAVAEEIKGLDLGSDDCDYTWIIDNAQSIKDVKAGYDELDPAQKYAVREELYDGSTEGLQLLLDAVKTIDTYNSFELVINHDSTFSSSWNHNGSPKGMTADQIRTQLKGVCFFDTYLDICWAYPDMIPVVEFKDAGMSADGVKKAIYMIEKSGQLAESRLVSFHPVLESVKAEADARLASQGKTSFTYYLIKTGEEWKVDKAAEEHYTGVSISKSVFTESLYNKAIGKGLGVGTWTYRSKAADDNYMYEQVMLHTIDFATVDYKVN